MTDGTSPGKVAAEFRSGSIAVLGKPNVGKSTLVNALTGSKVAIVSPKPQTTRTHLRGILNRDGAQIVFVDTPGAHRPRSRLNRVMMSAVEEALAGVDLFYLLLDAGRDPGREDEIALALARESGTAGFLVLNKTDTVAPARLLPLIERYRNLWEFAGYIPVSARTGENLPLLVEKSIELLPPGPPLYPPDEFTDQPARFMAAEIVREKLFRETQQEIPYNTAVAVEKYEEEGGLVRIFATILVERAGQKAIVIGSKGKMIKHIGTVARKEIEQLLGRRVYLELFVKVRENWQDNPAVRRLIDWRGA